MKKMITKIDLYGELLKLAPFQSDENGFREILKQALGKYTKLLCDVDVNDVGVPKNDWKVVVDKTNKRIEKIEDIAKNSYKGLPSTAYSQLRNLLDNEYRGILRWSMIPENVTFYRMRMIDERRTNISYKEMFHIPINNRRSVKTQRYSTPGFPCLYLGNSIYGCWEEMGRPLMSNCWVSRLKSIKSFCLLDLRIPDSTTFINNFLEYIQLFPLIIACMIPIKNNDDIYKPEYIVPQLLIEWIIKNRKDGIYYTSAHKNNDFDYPSQKSDNIAMPVKEPLMKVSNCPKLAFLFKISNPLNNEIEQLKCAYPIDGGVINAADPLEENYRTSNFHCLEDRLEMEKLYDLQ